MCVSVDMMPDVCREDLTECEVSNFFRAKPVKKMIKKNLNIDDCLHSKCLENAAASVLTVYMFGAC